MKKRIASLLCFATILIGTCAFSADSVDLGLGIAAFTAGQYRAALDRLGPLAEKGDPDAQLVLGHMYEGGFGVNTDSAQAASWFRKSAEQGNAPAQYMLGGMYLNGKGVARDNTVAASWFRKSAEQGNPPAQYMMGIIYTEGIGVPVDNQQAVIWFRKSAEQSVAPAQNALGWMYLSGEGVAQDNTEAASWFRRSADQGDATGQFYLGSMYLRGQGVAQDNVEAVRWLRKSADQGNVYGQAALGKMFVMGIAQPRNCTEAARWYRKASEGGHPNYRGFFAAREALNHIWSSYFYYIERYALFRRTVRKIGETSGGKILVEEQGESVRLSCGRRGMTVTYPFLNNEVLLDIFQGMKSLMADCLDGEKDERESDSERRILAALLSSLEKSSYQTCEEVGFLISENMDTRGGIGVEFQVGDSGLRVVESFEGGPAFGAGIREGDKIVNVDGRSTEKLPVAEARKLLMGKPGTTVHLRVFTGRSAEPINLTITREIFKTEELTSKNFGDGIGYIRIRYFRTDTDKRLDASLRDLGGNEKLKGLVLDLRSNPGGPLDQVWKISGVFIGPGPVAVVKGRRKDEVLTSRTNPKGTTYDAFHMVVLCDSETASGAEAVVAALKEHGRATVVGVPTSGKAFIQSTYFLSDGSAVKIGTAMLSTSKGNTLEGEGVQPDIVVRGGTRDTLIECGIQLLKGEVTEGGSGACR